MRRWTFPNRDVWQSWGCRVVAKMQQRLLVPLAMRCLPTYPSAYAAFIDRVENCLTEIWPNSEEARLPHLDQKCIRDKLELKKEKKRQRNNEGYFATPRKENFPGFTQRFIMKQREQSGFPRL